MERLPAQRTDGPYRIVLVCLGNICRSPMAHVVLAEHLDRAGLAAEVEVTSGGTGDWHVGGPMDRRAAAVLTSHGYDASQHRAQQFQPSWHDEHDLVLAMDAQNLADLEALAEQLAGTERRLRLFREFDPLATDGDLEVPDPYYGGDDGFDHVMAIVRRTADGLVEELARTVG
jgi:protein-tyrosine phosphatase